MRNNMKLLIFMKIKGITYHSLVNQVQRGGALGSNRKIGLISSAVYQSLLDRLARGREIIGNIAAIA